MKPLNLLTLALVVVGGLNWGLVGILDWNLVAAVLGDGSVLSRIVYALVGLSAVWQLVQLASAIGRDESSALGGHSAR